MIMEFISCRAPSQMRHGGANDRRQRRGLGCKLGGIAAEMRGAKMLHRIPPLDMHAQFLP